MREDLLGMLAAWARAYQAEPFYTTLIGVGVAMIMLLAAGAAFRARTLMKSELAGGPLLLIAALVIFGLCLLWAGLDGLLYWADAPLLSQRLLFLLVPAEFDDMTVLRQLLGSDQARLPGSVTMTIGLLAGTALCTFIANIIGNTLAEMIALQKKPEDILREERKKKLDAEAKKLAAELAADDSAGSAPEARPGDRPGDTLAAAPAARPDASPAPAGLAAEPDDSDDVGDEPGAPVAPLPDDRFGRIYKLAGHFYDHLHPESRFLRWQKALSITLFSLVGLGLFTAAGGYLPVPLWVGMTIFAAAFKQLTPAADPGSRPAQTRAATSDAAAPAQPASSRPAFAERAELASRLISAPRPAPRTLPRGSHAPAAPVHAPGVLDSITAALGIRRLHAHQAAAAAVFDARRSVLLCTPPGSGRQVLTDALALYAVLADGERVLHLSPDPARARAAHARFEARAEATHWKWNVLAVNLTDRAGILDPGQSQPALVFADPDTLHRQLCGQAGRWQTFLAGLGTLIVPDLHTYSGAPAAHLGHLLRRLDRVRRRARSAALGQGLVASSDHSPLRHVVTAHPGHGNLGRYVERIIGRAVEPIGPDRDGAPRPRQHSRVVPPGWQPGDHASAVHPALALRHLAERMGYVATLHGYEDLFTAAERGVADSLEHTANTRDPRADVIIARLTPASYARVPLDTAHLGAIRRTSSVAVLWQPDRAPLAEILATQRPPLDHPDLTLGQALVAWPGAPLVERGHLRASLVESEISDDELAQIFSRECLDRELAELGAQGRLIERHRRVLDIQAGAIRTVRTWSLATSEDLHAALGLRTTAEPWQLCERATGDALFALEADRARAAAYPGRVLVARGRRFTVLADTDQDQLERKRVLCEQTDAAVISAPIHTLHIELIERRQAAADLDAANEHDAAGTTAHASGDRRRSALRSLGGARFSMQQREVRVTETVTGVRRFDMRGQALDTTLYDQPIACAFTTRATVLGFVTDELPFAGHVSADTLHALAHGFGQALGALLCHGEDDLDIAALPRTEDWSVPALAFVDMHPGGAGFSEAVTLDMIRSLSRWTLALIRGCPTNCDSGCPACLHTVTCRAPGEHYQRLDRRGAEALLCAVLGEPIPERPAVIKAVPPP